MGKLKQLLIGKPLNNTALQEEKYSVFWGLPILSSDAISSIAYASEEILLVLVPAIGLLAYHQLTFISMAIIGLLAILTFSYRQTIASYPNGGGAYVVASDNLGATAGVLAGSALAIDYVLTVAVSISAGTAAITSAVPFLFNHRVLVCLVLLALIFIGNMRGLRESSRLFGIPAYAFMFSIVLMIVVGVIKVVFYGKIPPQPHLPPGSGLEPLSIFLILKAFSSGCAALTGVEAVTNAVPNFKEPEIKHAQHVLMLLSFIVLILFGGTSILANLYHVAPTEGKTVLALINEEIFGHSFLYYFIQVITAIILTMAANTAYSGFPMLFSVMAKDGFVPRQMSMRGDRLNFSNGIVVLTVLAGALIIGFKGDTHLLIPLYAVGVFISFTLSQTGMFLKWLRSDEKNRIFKAAVNGTGMVLTGVAVIIIGSTKFMHGAWIVVVVIPILMIIMLRIKHHYNLVAEKLRLNPEEISAIDFSKHTYDNHVIVPIDSINRASIRALRYAKTISHKVIAFNVSITRDKEQKIREQWAQLKIDIPLIVRYSPYRKVLKPLFDFIETYEENQYKKGDMITIVLPQFSVNTWWEFFLHNQTRFFITKELMKHEHVVIATMPLQLRLVEHGVEKFLGDAHKKNGSYTLNQ